MFDIRGSTYNHLLQFINSDTLALDDLNILETTQNVVLHFESSSEVEFRTFLDLERVILQSLESIRSRELKRGWRTTFRVHLEGKDDAVTRVAWVTEILSTTTKSERFLVALKRFIFSI